MIKDWVQAIADEIIDQHEPEPSFGYYRTVITKHCPFKPDIDYMPVPRCDSCNHEWDALLEYTAPNGPMKVVGPWSCKKCGYTVTVIPDGLAYMPVPRCDSCKWWHGPQKFADGREQCTEPTISPEQMDEFMTPPDYGCVCHKEKL